MMTLRIVMSDKPRRPATYEDLEALPPHYVGEIRYELLNTWAGEVSVRAEPFEAIELSLRVLWEE